MIDASKPMMDILRTPKQRLKVCVNGIEARVPHVRDLSQYADYDLFYGNGTWLRPLGSVKAHIGSPGFDA
jgi:hypothetical protein